MLCILSFLSAEDITNEQLWHTILRAVYIKYFYLLYRQLCLTWYSHVNFTCQIHVENHLTRNTRGRFTWNSHEAQMAANVWYIIGFQKFFPRVCFLKCNWLQVCSLQSLDENLSYYLTVFNKVYLIVMIQMLDVFTLWKKSICEFSMIINMK